MTSTEEHVTPSTIKIFALKIDDEKFLKPEVDVVTEQRKVLLLFLIRVRINNKAMMSQMTEILLPEKKYLQ